MSGGKILEQIEIDLRNHSSGATHRLYLDIYDHHLSRKWLTALNELLRHDYHLEKNFCFLGFADSPRDGELILDQINRSINAINDAEIGYHIDDYFTMSNSVVSDQSSKQFGEVDHEHLNLLHRYFEDLQGVSGSMSNFFTRADTKVRWHIRQLNLLCHEFESWVLSNRKKHTAPEWMRPSQLMCWLNAPRFVLDTQDLDVFGIETMNRSLGGVYVGVNKAIGKHHWEVFVDEAHYDPAMIMEDLTTTSMRGQTEASGDFDIEWGNNPGQFAWQKQHLADFRSWLINNGLDPDDKSLTIGHPQVGQIDLTRSFGTVDYQKIWHVLEQHLDVWRITTSTASAEYNYSWSDDDFIALQIQRIAQGN